MRAPFSYQPAGNRRKRSQLDSLPDALIVFLLLGLSALSGLISALLLPAPALLILFLLIDSRAVKALFSRQGAGLFILLAFLFVGRATGFTRIWPPDPERLRTASILSARLLLIIMTGHTLTAALPASRLAALLSRPASHLPSCLAPLRRLLLNTALLIRLTLRWLPLLFRAHQQRREAMLSRGAFNRGYRLRQMLHPLRAVRRTALPMVETALREASLLADAMESRGVRLDPTLPQRTPRKRL